jgi:hypothetical protein
MDKTLMLAAAVAAGAGVAALLIWKLKSRCVP